MIISVGIMIDTIIIYNRDDDNNYNLYRVYDLGYITYQMIISVLGIDVDDDDLIISDRNDGL